MKAATRLFASGLLALGLATVTAASGADAPSRTGIDAPELARARKVRRGRPVDHAGRPQPARPQCDRSADRHPGAARPQPPGRNLVSRQGRGRRHACHVRRRAGLRAACAAGQVQDPRPRRARCESRRRPLPARDRGARLRQRAGRDELAHGEPCVQGLRRRRDPARGQVPGTRPGFRRLPCAARSTSRSSRANCRVRSASPAKSIQRARR